MKPVRDSRRKLDAHAKQSPCTDRERDAARHGSRSKGPSRLGDPESWRRYAIYLIGELIKLREKSDPANGEVSRDRKDLNAFRALRLAHDLTNSLVGWAIDHQTGLAIEGLTFVPLQPYQIEGHPDYLAAQRAVDDHRHEIVGAKARGETLKPPEARNLLVGLLRANPGAFPGKLIQPVVEALEALEYGEVQPVFVSVRRGRKAKLRKLRLQMLAIAFVEYRRARGSTKENATADVADAFGVSADAVVKWEQRLRSEFGSLEVSRRQAFARNAGENADKAKRNGRRQELSTLALGDMEALGEDEYGESARRNAGRRYYAPDNSK